MNLFNPKKFARGCLEGVDGNAFSLMSFFKSRAKDSGWSDDEIQAVISKAKESSYDTLIATLDAHLSTNNADFNLKSLFPVISDETFASDQEKLKAYLYEYTVTGSSPMQLKNPKSLNGKLIVAMFELIDRFEKSDTIFYLDDGIDSIDSHAVDLDHNGSLAVSNLFDKLKQNLVDDTSFYKSFLANVLQELLNSLSTGKDSNCDIEFSNYHCEYGLRTCEECSGIFELEEVSDEYGPWLCECCQEESEEEDY